MIICGFLCISFALALPNAPGNVWVDAITPISAKIHWTKSTQAKGPIANSEPLYVVQFRTLFTNKPLAVDWSEQGEDDIGTNLEFTLSGLLPYTIYEYKVVPYVQYGRGTPSAVKQFRTEESG